MSQVQGTATEIPPGKVPLDYLMYMRGIKNQELAERTKIPASEVTRMRKGMRPSEARCKAVAKFLKVSQADLGWEAANV